MSHSRHELDGTKDPSSLICHSVPELQWWIITRIKMHLLNNLMTESSWPCGLLLINRDYFTFLFLFYPVVLGYANRRLKSKGRGWSSWIVGVCSGPSHPYTLTAWCMRGICHVLSFLTRRRKKKATGKDEEISALFFYFYYFEENVNSRFCQGKGQNQSIQCSSLAHLKLHIDSV